MSPWNMISCKFGNHKGSRNPFHRHKWVPLRDHELRRYIWPFELEDDILDRMRVCWCGKEKILPEKK